MPGLHLEPDLAEYTARGFSPEHDKNIADTGVAEPDLTQALGMVRVCEATEAIIYDGSFSPRRIRYQRGTRPLLEKVAGVDSRQAGLEKVLLLMQWVFRNIRHAWTSEADVSATRGWSEEQIISSGIGWCNEQVRVFVALCEINELPARICFVFHQNLPFGHAASEVMLDGRWCFFDPTFDLHVALPDGRPAEGRELAGGGRSMAHRAYRSAYDRFAPTLARRWRDHFHNTHDALPDRPGDLVALQGISNYLIAGVDSLEGNFHQPFPYVPQDINNHPRSSQTSQPS